MLRATCISTSNYPSSICNLGMIS